jgi:hypothetical protein
MTGEIKYRLGNEKLVKIHETAGAKLTSLLTRQGRPGGALRVAVIGGGCSACNTKWISSMAPRTATSWSRAQASASSSTRRALSS